MVVTTYPRDVGPGCRWGVMSNFLILFIILIVWVFFFFTVGIYLCIIYLFLPPPPKKTLALGNWGLCPRVLTFENVARYA